MFFEIEGFHTCLNKGSPEEIKEAIPFLSEREEQWLGQGYYFWSESDYWAKLWKRNEDTVIGEFFIKIPQEKFLDLNSVKKQIWLKATMEKLTTLLKHGLNVSEVLYYLIEKEKLLRNGKMFPYVATRAKDKRCVQEVPFLLTDKADPEVLCLVERQQICVYPTYKETQGAEVNFVRFVWPLNFG